MRQVLKRYRHLSAFVAAVVLSEALIGLLKGTYDRARPPGSLVATSGASFPSGHAVAASVTVVAVVIALVPAGRRTPWALAAALCNEGITCDRPTVHRRVCGKAKPKRQRKSVRAEIFANNLRRGRA